jgi:molybdate/tungstate transport system substrate-binding protein
MNIIFTMQLAASYYQQPDLVDKILGPQINPRQIFQEAEVMARLQAGQLDASSAYKTQPSAFGLPYITLPKAINLGDASMESAYRTARTELKGKTQHPQPLVFYAAVLKDAAQPRLAARFVSWMRSSEAQHILARYHYDDRGDAKALTP